MQSNESSTKPIRLQEEEGVKVHEPVLWEYAIVLKNEVKICENLFWVEEIHS
jgi:hypothetical protein